MLAAKGADDTDEDAIAVVIDGLLTRAESGPDRRIAARTKAATAVPALPPARRELLGGSSAGAPIPSPSWPSSTPATA
ncbi:hypothetical protein [Streptomyces sp. NPDC060031]|uniref:hypothetical protein n=1 Tax=Streptomyces sp. NPDC060031 TaxID=3347043 RepID=UPI0036805A60